MAFRTVRTLVALCLITADFPRLTTSTGFQAGAAVQVTRWFALFADIALRGEFDSFWSFADIVEGNSRVAFGLVVRLGG